MKFLSFEIHWQKDLIPKLQFLFLKSNSIIIIKVKRIQIQLDQSFAFVFFGFISNENGCLRKYKQVKISKHISLESKHS